jgi:hypothetical protein
MRKQVRTYRLDDLAGSLDVLLQGADGTVMSHDSEMDHLEPNRMHGKVSLNDGHT